MGAQQQPPAAVGVPSSPSPGQRQLLELAEERLRDEISRRAAGQAGAGAGAASSNYDYVKIKVRLGSNLEHYYILSRFILSRMLTVITLPQHKAIRIALDVKKHLVDHSRLDITQEELEEVLFQLLHQRGYGPDYVRRYQMVTRFFQQKRPLIILVAGSACTGKSSLAQQLASRLNMPNVLQTDVLCELLRSSGMGDLPAEPLWQRALPPGASLEGEFQRECAIIRQALDGDLCKCIRDGKSIIIEGMHIDPGLFLREFGDPRGEPVPVDQSSSLGLSHLEGTLAAAAVAAGAAGGPPSAEEEAKAAGAGAQQLEGLQLVESDSILPAEQLPWAPAPPGPLLADPHPNSGDRSSRVSAAFNGAPSACALSPPPLPPQQQQQQQRQQQLQQPPAGLSRMMAAAPLPDLLEGEATGAAALAGGVRRTASYGDAVSHLSYASTHRQQSPWKDASSLRRALRPQSARVSESLEQRGQAVFMLQSTEASFDGSAGEAAAPALPPPVPSPRLSACISLPPVPEHNAELQRLPGSGDSGSSSSALPSLGATLAHSAGGESCSSSSRGSKQLAAAAAGQGGVQPLPHLGQGGVMAGFEAQPPAADSQQVEAAPVQVQSAAALAAPPSPQQPQHGSQSQLQAQAHSSVAAADAAAAAAAGTGPVFVPICLAVRDDEYEGMLLNWLSPQQQAGGSSSNCSSSSSSGGVPADVAVERLRGLQAHLRRYAASGVPVVELNLTDMGRALDSMHAYVLQCIELATYGVGQG